jgi:hypothetical protein
MRIISQKLHEKSFDKMLDQEERKIIKLILELEKDYKNYVIVVDTKDLYTEIISIEKRPTCDKSAQVDFLVHPLTTCL